MRELRARQQRNFLATLLLSQGIPMLSHGDELGRTQRGNNNAYCQDNEISWIDWQARRRAGGPARLHLPADRPAPRAPVLRRRRFFRGDTARHPDQPLPDLVWLAPDAREMSDDDWLRSDAHSVGVFLNGDAIAEPDPRGRPSSTTRSCCCSTVTGNRSASVCRTPPTANGGRR